MNLKTIIVEDEQENVDVLKHFLATYCSQVDVLETASSVSEAYRKITENQIDLIFLDIMLEEGTGFELLQLIKNKNIPVIFTTAYSEHALKAFKFSAVDYLLKPIQIDELVNAVEKVKQKFDKNQLESQLKILLSELAPQGKSNQDNDEFIAISMSDKIEFIKKNDILFLEADGKYTNFYLLGDKKIVSSKNLGEFEKLLSENDLFFRVHNTFIVNLNFIQKIEKTDGLVCIMTNKISIPISRRKKDDLFNRLKLSNNS